MNSRRSRCMIAVVRKEWAQIRRDFSVFGIAGLLPLLLLFIFGISLDTESIPTGLVVHDKGISAQRLSHSVAVNGLFRVEFLSSVSEGRGKMVAGTLQAIIVILIKFLIELRRREQ